MEKTEGGNQTEVRLIIRLTPKMGELLDDLVETGLYGDNRADAARRLVERGLENVLGAGDID